MYAAANLLMQVDGCLQLPAAKLLTEHWMFSSVRKLQLARGRFDLYFPADPFNIRACGLGRRNINAADEV